MSRPVAVSNTKRASLDSNTTNVASSPPSSTVTATSTPMTSVNGGASVPSTSSQTQATTSTSPTTTTTQGGQSSNAAAIANIPRVGDTTRSVLLPDIIINPSNGHQLSAALRHAADGQTVRIDDGCYEIDDDITISKYTVYYHIHTIPYHANDG
jgi:hypothetical protein